MRAAWVLLLVLLGCEEEQPRLKFRAPQTQRAPASTITLTPTPETRPATTMAASTQSSDVFSCELGGAPWVLAPSQKVQGLLLERPAIEKGRPPTRVITVSLQSATNERLLIEIAADKEPIQGAKITHTTRSDVSKATTTLQEVTKRDEAERFLLSFSMSAELQPLSGGPTIPVRDCVMRELSVRTLKTESTPPEE